MSWERNKPRVQFCLANSSTCLQSLSAEFTQSRHRFVTIYSGGTVWIQCSIVVYVYNYLPQKSRTVSKIRFASSTINYYLANIPSCRKENRHNYILGLLHSQVVSIVQYQCWNLCYIDCSNNVFHLPAPIFMNKHNINTCLLVPLCLPHNY